MRQFFLVAVLFCAAFAVGAQDTPSSTPPSTAPAPGTVASSGGAPTIANPPAGPTQPVAFSHKQHAGAMKLECNFCHAPIASGSALALPQAAKCMQCHAAVATDKPDIKKIADAAQNNQLLPWARVYRVPSFVTFSHKTHTSAGATCADCHGPVAEREVIAREKDLSMGGCISCHTQKNAPTGCDTCHQLNSVLLKKPMPADHALLASLFSRERTTSGDRSLQRFLTPLGLAPASN